MTSSSRDDYFVSLISELRQQPSESDWFEFKENYANPEAIGEYLSALGNGAALKTKELVYVVWGIREGTQEVVGTTLVPARTKTGNGDLEAWL